MTINQKILFVHIPKTGGTSILNKLDQTMWKKVVHGGHDPLFLIEQNNNIEDALSFCVVRNPYKRTFSYYKHFNRVNNLNYSFLQFLRKIKNKEFFKKTPMIVYPQSFYIYNLQGSIGINKIYKFEKFYQLENELNIKFDRLNVGNYTLKEYKEAYKYKKNIDMVRELFSIDFFNFNYNLNDI